MIPARLARLAVVGILGLMTGCIGEPIRPLPPVTTPSTPAPPATEIGVTPPPPANIDAIPDAVPRIEARSLRGNPASYEVFGKRYSVMASAEGLRERGVASWYGPTFHAKATSSGEPYDMYAMTAAHKTMPIPAYVRVTNLGNGRSVVVRVNDRGPFVDNRIIDLSYTAAHKLDMTRAGTAFVEIEVITPGTLQEAARGVTPAEPPQTLQTALYLQAGAFSVAANASQLQQRLQREGINAVNLLPPDTISVLYRVRVGPIADVATFDTLAQRMARLGIEARLISE
jgi:rare lipoprotein A